MLHFKALIFLLMTISFVLHSYGSSSVNKEELEGLFIKKKKSNWLFEEGERVVSLIDCFYALM